MNNEDERDYDEERANRAMMRKEEEAEVRWEIKEGKMDTVWVLIRRDADSWMQEHMEVFSEIPAIWNDGTVEWGDCEEQGVMAAFTSWEIESNWGGKGQVIEVWECGVNGGDSEDVTEQLLRSHGDRDATWRV